MEEENMAQRHTVSGRRPALLWLSSLIGLALLVALVVIVLFVYPTYQRRQQVEQHYQAGVAFQEVEDWDKAVEAFEKVVAMDATYNDVRSRLAEVRAKQQEANAIAHAAAATATAEALETHYQKGLAYMNLERWEEAKAEMEQVLEVDPDYKETQEKLAQIEQALTNIAPTLTARSPKTALEVAARKPATASGFWRYSDNHLYPPSNIVDRTTDEPDGCGPGASSYWLLPDNQTGWAQVDLQQNYTIVKLRWLNTHNGRCGGDRATTRFHIVVSQSGAFKGEERVVYSGTMKFSVSPIYQEAVLSPPVEARYVRFYVDEYYRAGGGLNELEVYAEVPAP
jgi:tetratricopeptide (TPR) repeat protein